MVSQMLIRNLISVWNGNLRMYVHTHFIICIIIVSCLRVPPVYACVGLWRLVTGINRLITIVNIL